MSGYPNTFNNPGRIGRRVLYCLGEHDVREIIMKKQRRGTDSASFNEPREGDVVPGIIIRDWYIKSEGRPMNQPDATDEDMERLSSVNIQLFLDGDASHWVTSRSMWTEDISEEYQKGRWIFATM
jgi:hypothetical protein